MFMYPGYHDWIHWLKLSAQVPTGFVHAVYVVSTSCVRNVYVIIMHIMFT